jgi:hypothetical protein
VAQTEEQKKIIKQWVRNLESGLYKQTKDTLCNVAGEGLNTGKKNDSFCCLGVLCDMAVRAGVISKAVTDDDGQMLYDGESGTLPKSVIQWAGLRTEDGEYETGKTDAYGPNTYTLAKLNDRGKSFKHIAKVIKSAPEGLFV